MFSQKNLFFLCTVLLISLTACAGKTKAPETPSPGDSRIADVRTFPQDPFYYAKQVGKNKALLDTAEQLDQDRRFNSIFFGPWAMTRGTTKKANACIRKARGYKLGGLRWPQEEWDIITKNANMETFPSLAQPAITLRNTDLREMPTHEARYDKVIINERSYPFDDFQYSLLGVGTPLFITHQSLDGRWYFVECPIAGGWVDANDVAPVSTQFMTEWRNHALAAIVKDHILLKGVGTPGMIGTILPMKSKSGNSVHLLVPGRAANGYADLREVTVHSTDAHIKPLPITPNNVAALANQMMGQAYGWGGMYGLRDCSQTTHDLLAPFGIWLPRNSRAQAKTGVVMTLEGMGRDEKEQIIKQYGTPFLSLVGLPGHITMYIGTYNGKVALLHNVWGVRTVEGANDNARHIIGKTVITSIAPGWELPNLYRPVSFVDRLRSLATPGKR
ncbi:MAG: SH3 domain-containing protein [Desulfovibrio sp.]|nr:SH3 domain-containing protein [Desulfovibrio sp.]